MNQIWYPKSENLDDQHIQGTIKKKEWISLVMTLKCNTDIFKAFA